MKFYIHPGLTKTGSTAIQKYLHENTKSLERIGYYYPESTDTSQPTLGPYYASGNGHDLYLKIQENSLNNEEKLSIISEFVCRWMNDAKSRNCKNIVISSESLCMLKQDDINSINKALIDLQIKYSYVYYIRQPYNWIFSSWLQGVKREGIKNWLSEILGVDANYALHPLIFPESIKRLTPPELFIEHKYEDVRSNLIGSFLTSLGISSETQNSLPKPETAIVNRSVTDHEFAISFYTNKASQGNVKLSELLSLLIIDDNNLKNRSRFFFVDKYTLDRVIEWCRSNSPSIFEAYSNDLYRMTDEAIPVSESSFRNKLSPDQCYSIRAIEEIARFYSGILDEARKLAYHKCAIYSNSEFVNKVPGDFNVFMYLMLNTDVLFSSKDPYWHYFHYGNRDNRVFKLPE